MSGFMTKLLTRTFETPGWIGTQEDLLKLVRELQDIVDELIVVAKAAHDAAESDAKAEWFAARGKLAELYSDEDWDQLWTPRWAEKRRRMKLEANATMPDLNEERSGPAAEVCESLTEPERVQSLVLQYGSKYGPPNVENGYIKISFRSDARPRVEMAASDLGWLDATEKRLARVLERRTPDYKRWLPSEGAELKLATLQFVLGAILGLTIAVGFYVAIRRADLLFGILVAMAAISVPYVTINSFRRMYKRLPRFELIEPGTKAQGSTIVKWVSSAAAWVVGSIAIPVLLWVFTEVPSG